MLEYVYDEANYVEARKCCGVALVVPDQATAAFCLAGDRLTTQRRGSITRRIALLLQRVVGHHHGRDLAGAGTTAKSLAASAG